MNAFSKTLRKVFQKFGYTLTRCQKRNGYPVDFTGEEVDLIEYVKPYTLTQPERIQALIHAVKYVRDAGIPGDIVECGVWLGGSMMTVARTLMETGDTTRKLWLYDTFEGMTAPSEHDISTKGTKASEKFEKKKLSANSSDWCYASLEEVVANLEKTAYPRERLEFVKGMVETTLLEKAPDQIALLRLDTDWYESTLLELELLFPKLARGGILIIDDYGDWSGARKAVDEYFEKHQIPFFLGRIDHSARIGVKQ